MLIKGPTPLVQVLVGLGTSLLILLPAFYFLSVGPAYVWAYTPYYDSAFSRSSSITGAQQTEERLQLLETVYEPLRWVDRRVYYHTDLEICDQYIESSITYWFDK